MVMTEAGHALAHLPQPTHLSGSTWARIPRGTEIAPRGQAFTQHPQATQRSPSTMARRRERRLTASMTGLLPVLNGAIIAHSAPGFCDKRTVPAVGRADCLRRPPDSGRNAGKTPPPPNIGAVQDACLFRYIKRWKETDNIC